MNVFHTHSRIVSDYATYIRSFLKIADPQLREVVEGELSKGKLWPEPLLQFNPSFAMLDSLDDLVVAGTLHPDIRDIFKGYKLYRHQRDFAIDLKKDNYRHFILQVMAMLEQADYLKSQTARNEKNEEVPIYRLRLEKIIWKLGDGKTVKADVISYAPHAPPMRALTR